jgi:hypothetical protein
MKTLLAGTARNLTIQAAIDAQADEIILDGETFVVGGIKPTRHLVIRAATGKKAKIVSDKDAVSVPTGIRFEAVDIDFEVANGYALSTRGTDNSLRRCSFKGRGAITAKLWKNLVIDSCKFDVLGAYSLYGEDGDGLTVRNCTQEGSIFEHCNRFTRVVNVLYEGNTIKNPWAAPWMRKKGNAFVGKAGMDWIIRNNTITGAFSLGPADADKESLRDVLVQNLTLIDHYATIVADSHNVTFDECRLLDCCKQSRNGAAFVYRQLPNRPDPTLNVFNTEVTATPGSKMFGQDKVLAGTALRNDTFNGKLLNN